MMNAFSFNAQLEDRDKRLDQFLKEKIPDFSRSKIQYWIEQGVILVNQKKGRSALRLKGDENISGKTVEEELTLAAEPIPLKIIYEDKAILVINKSAGIVTHPAKGHRDHTLANGIAYHLKQNKSELFLDHESQGAEGLRLGLVHRLDKETSGVLVVAKTFLSQKLLSEQFKDRKVKKVYRAITTGRLKVLKGEIEGSIGRAYHSNKMDLQPQGKFARTEFKVLKLFPEHSYIEVYPQTGRTHQIRLHFSKIGNPILGDTLYGIEDQNVPRQMLHAFRLKIEHPVSRKWIQFEAPLPKDFLQTLKFLKNKVK